MATTPSSRSRRKKEGPSQLVDLFLHVAEHLGLTRDRDIADLAGVSVENVANWRSGAVQEFKARKLETIKARLAAHIDALQEEVGAVDKILEHGLNPLEIEVGSGPADLQRQFRDRVVYDYLGHRFLYYEPMGALAWENLIRRGYEQDGWVAGVKEAATAWLDPSGDRHGRAQGPLAHALGLSRRGASIGLDAISLGPGEGQKEVAFLETLLNTEKDVDQRLGWLCYVPVDVSIPLLLSAARSARKAVVDLGSSVSRARYQVKPFCADFEEGDLAFNVRLPTSIHGSQDGLRLVMMLGNTFGNLRDEERFVKQKLWKLLRPGDYAWIEVGLRLDPLTKDPLYRSIEADVEESSAEANRRLLLEGPYRRWEAATGRRPTPIDMRIWLRQDDESCRVPGAVNFCHDLLLKEENRRCTMLYSRRYEIEALTGWLERLGFEVERIRKVEDSRGVARVAHLLLRARNPG